MCCGQRNVLAESILLALAHNINKHHNKIQSGGTDNHLFQLNKTAYSLKKLSPFLLGLLKCTYFYKKIDNKIVLIIDNDLSISDF